jgi:hypothetical protein
LGMGESFILTTWPLMEVPLHNPFVNLLIVLVINSSQPPGLRRPE